MRRWLLLASAALLAGCGDNGEDFTVDVAMAPGQVQAELARLDGGLALRALSLAAISGTQDGNALSFTLPGDEDSGELQMRFDEIGTNMTRIHVSLTLPAQTTTIEGQRMVLSEDKAENLLQTRMTTWAESIATKGYGSTDELNEVLGGVSMAMQPDKLGAVLAAGDDPDKLSQLLDPQVMAEMMGGSPAQSYAEAAPLDKPMIDPARSAATAGRPMDTAQGTAPQGIAPKAAWAQ